MATARLTPKQMLFVEAYVSCFNISQAARQAGYSERNAHVIGAETLRKPLVKAEIDRRFAALVEERALHRKKQHNEICKLKEKLLTSIEEDPKRLARNVEVFCRLLEREAKLLGLDAPEQQNVSGAMEIVVRYVDGVEAAEA